MISIRLIRQQNRLGLGAAPLDLLFLLSSSCMTVCTSSLVLLPALRISHLRLRAFHQHCSEHYSCIVAMINFCLFPLQRKCKTVAACECLKVPCPTPALTVNSLHTSAMHVSFITLYPVWNMFTPKSFFRGRQHSFYSHSIHPHFSHTTKSARMLHWSFSYFAIQLTRQFMEDIPHVLSIPTASAQVYIWDMILHTQSSTEIVSFAQGGAGSSVYWLSW